MSTSLGMYEQNKAADPCGGLPRLDDSRHFQEWALEQYQKGSIEDSIAKLLTQENELATFRAACLGQWFIKPNKYRNLMREAFTARDLAIRHYAQSFLVLLDFLENRNDVTYCVPLLEDSLVKLEALNPSPLCLEAKNAVLTNLGLIKSALGEYVQSKALAAQAVFLARHAGTAICEMRASNLLVQNNILSGQASEGLAGIRQNLEKRTIDHHAATYQQISVAGCLTHLGDVHGALKWLDSSRLNPVNPHAIEAVYQWFSCLAGYDDPSVPIEERYLPANNVRWLVLALREMLAAKALPRTSRSLPQRKNYLNCAITISRGASKFASDWYYLLNRWIAATALQWQGKATLSAHSLTGLRQPAREWLELRLLLAGLRLEQALDLNLPGLAIESVEQELLSVFQDAQSIPMASPSGLADLLMFWHPLAAAYMAVAFPNLPHLSPALEGILRLGSKNSADGETVSPALASELLLRSLGLDLVEGQPLSQVKLGAGERGNFRECLLIMQRGQRRYYQTPISALQIAYGLKKHGSDAVRSGVAWGILNQYGLCPRGSGLEIQERMNTLETLAQRMLKEQISIQDFCEGCFTLV